MNFRANKSTWGFLIVAVLIFAVTEILFRTGRLSEFWGNLVRTGGILAIVSLGLNLIYGFNGQFSLGQWGFYAIGAYASADITYRWVNNKSADGLIVLLLITGLSGLAILALRRFLSRIRGLDALSAFSLYLIAVIALCFLSVYVGNAVNPALTALLQGLGPILALQIVFFLAVIIGGILAAEISFLFGLPVLTLGSDYFGIATLGFTIIVKVLADNSDTMLGFEEMKGARGMIGIPQVTTWAWIFLFLLAVVIITRNLLHSSYGRAIVSVREDEIAAKTMGIDVAHYKILTFVLGSFFAGIAGGLYAHNNAFLHPSTFNFIRSFDPMIIIVFGGLGSVSGTLFASFAWVLVLEGFLRTQLPEGFEAWRFVVYPLLLLVMMLVRPKGLLGDFEFPFLRQGLPSLPPTARARLEEDIPPASIEAVMSARDVPDAPPPTSANQLPHREEVIE
jgi:branched-chain amino acid transport system permease protein